MSLHDGTIQLSADTTAEAGEKAENAKTKKKSSNAKQQQKQKTEKKQPERYPKDEPLVAAEKIVDRLLSCCATDEYTRVAHYNLAFRKG